MQARTAWRIHPLHSYISIMASLPLYDRTFDVKGSSMTKKSVKGTELNQTTQVGVRIADRGDQKILAL